MRGQLLNLRWRINPRVPTDNLPFFWRKLGLKGKTRAKRDAAGGKRTSVPRHGSRARSLRSIAINFALKMHDETTFAFYIIPELRCCVRRELERRKREKRKTESERCVPFVSRFIDYTNGKKSRLRAERTGDGEAEFARNSFSHFLPEARGRTERARRSCATPSLPPRSLPTTMGDRQKENERAEARDSFLPLGGSLAED